jgi:putative glutamine amidotransferase
MDDPCRKPVVGIPSSRFLHQGARMHGYSVSETTVQSLLAYGECLPIQLPPIGDKCAIEQLVGLIDGLMLPGGRANVEPHHYGGPAFPDDEIIDPGRDAVVLKLIPACLEAGVPVFGICRGIQEINVALGGSLHYRVHLVAGKLDHRRPQVDDMPVEEIFKLRHGVNLESDGLFSRLLGGASAARVNSLHGQGIDRLASELQAEAVSEDGLIEGVRLKNGGPFCVGVQWHAEYEPKTHALSDGLYKEFVRACTERAARRAA